MGNRMGAWMLCLCARGHWAVRRAEECCQLCANVSHVRLSAMRAADYVRLPVVCAADHVRCQWHTRIRGHRSWVWIGGCVRPMPRKSGEIRAVGCARLPATCDCQLCTPVGLDVERSVGLSAVYDCQLCTDW